ncbi:WXG100-like domain-containing protein [Nocardia terpenica]|uniref:Outer membrane channel protein CpnT-like N-terminal domain-containing protein n=1 Tax=Nocardia terpenica TaxID=455432 RepID=A0A291RDI3_9NOCA|nr:hypothetical protein [Nocardia terpenica]ATL65162.1 hypothetical protein CRH09_01850 [Nocardia terpenica]
MGNNPGGYEGTQIPNGGERAQTWLNGQLKDAFDPLNVDNARAVRDQYVSVINLWQQGVGTFARSIHRSISEAWEGVSAEAAKTAITNYANAAQDLTTPLQQLANNVNDCAEAVVKTKAAIPDTVHIDATSWLNPFHRHTLEQRQGEHRQQAWEAFTRLYVDPLAGIDAKIPILPAASNPTHPESTTPGLDGTGSGSGGDWQGGTPHTNEQGGGPDESRGPGDPSQPAPDSQQPGQQQPASGQSPDASGRVGSGTNPAGVDPSSVLPSSLDPSTTSTTPSGVSSTGLHPGGGSGGLGGFGGGAVPGGPGRSIPGTSAPGVGQNPAAAAARAAGAGSPGMTGMPGMGAPAKGKGGDEEKTHKRADYLTNEDNTRELLGEEPRTIPGVIGGDYRDYR